MSPYRDNVVPTAEPRRAPRKRLTSQRKMAGILLAVAAGHAVIVAALQPLGPWAVGGCVGLIVLGIVIAIAGRSRTPYTRLCAMLWNRGDRLGATMLLFGVIQPRYSQKRVARNAAALAAAQVGMLKYSKRWYMPDENER